MRIADEKMGYHYTESGLDYVYLDNGYTIDDTPYGKGVSIHDTDQLHKLLADWMVDQSRPLTGAELSFIRAELEMSQRNLAELLGTSEVTYRRWERARAKDIPGAADRLLRGLYKEFEHGRSSVLQIVERMASPGAVEKRLCVRFRATAMGWRPIDSLD
jgi:DNA-binding transcriptional regulator YiaG